MNRINWVKAAKLAGASMIATIILPTAPALAANVIFASQGSSGVSAKNGGGEQQFDTGIIQLKLDDGTTVSIVGPARFDISADGQLRVSEGSFTAFAPANSVPQPIFTGNGGQAQLRRGSSSSGKIGANGQFSGFVLTGNMQVVSNGNSKSLSAGRAFRAGPKSSPAFIVTAGAQTNRNGGLTPLQQLRLAQLRAIQYLAKTPQNSPTSIGFSGILQPQNFAPGTFSSAVTSAQIQAALQAQTGPLNPAVTLQLISDILAAAQSSGGLGSYTALNNVQIQALLFNLQKHGVPPGISAFRLQQFLNALGGAGFTTVGISGNGPSFASIAELFALIASGSAIPAGDATVQTLVNTLDRNLLPTGVDAGQLISLLELAGYTIPDALRPPMPTPTPTPAPTLADSDGMRPDGSANDTTVAFAKITETGLDQDVTILFENDAFAGYRLRSGFEIKFPNRNEIEKGGDQGTIGWSRLAGGTGALGSPRRANSGDHFVFGVPLINRPTSGTVNYELIGITHPTIRDGSIALGSFDGKLAVAFGATDIRLGLDAKVYFSSDTYNILTDGGLSAPSIGVTSKGRFAGNANLPNGVGVACNQGNCRFVFEGFLAGSGASHAGFAYTVRDDRGNNVSKWIDGSASFRKTGAVSPPPTQSGTVRASQYVVYAAGNNIGIDSRTPRPNQSPAFPLNVTYSNNGAPIGYEWSASESPTIGNAKEFESGRVGDIIGWTRWADGTADGSFYSNSQKTFSAKQGWHLLGGTPVTNLPTTGSVTYELVGATSPTIRDGSLSPGSFSGSLGVAFGATPMVGFDFAVDIGGSNYSFATAGGAADPSNGGRAVETSGDFAFTFFANDLQVMGTGSVCGGSGACNAALRGFLAGNGASHVGVSYTFGNGSSDQRVDGVAAFGKPGFAP